MSVVRVLFGVISLVGCGDRASDTRPPIDTHHVDTATDPTDETGPTPWPADLLAILTPGCGGCHGAGGCSSLRCFLDDYNAVSSRANVAACADQSIGACIVTRIHDGSMPPGGCPPGGEGCISDSEMQILESWVETLAP